MSFPFENLDVYKKSQALIENVDRFCLENKGKMAFSFEDQLRRAVVSIALNIAEGNGRWHKKEKQQFFWIARGSTFEIVPLIQILRRRNLLSEDVFSDLYRELEIVAKMLTNLIKSVENLDRQSGNASED